MPLDDVGGLVEAVAVGFHGQGRGGHNEDHDAVADGAAQGGDEEAGLAGDGEERSRFLHHCSFHSSRHTQAQEQEGGKAVETKDSDEGAEVEFVAEPTCEPIFGAGGEPGAEEGGDDSASDDPGDRLGPEGFFGDVGGGEAVVANEAIGDTKEGHGQGEDPEIGDRQAINGNTRAQQTNAGASEEAAAPTDALHEQRCRDGGDHSGQLADGEGQGGKGFVGGEGVADEDGVGGHGQGLAEGEEADLLFGFRGADDGGWGCHGRCKGWGLSLPWLILRGYGWS